jgi:hypothetical protein
MVRGVIKPPGPAAAPPAAREATNQGRGGENLVDSLISKGKKLPVQPGGEPSTPPPEDPWSTSSWPRPLNRGMRVPLFVDPTIILSPVPLSIPRPRGGYSHLDMSLVVCDNATAIAFDIKTILSCCSAMNAVRRGLI